MSVVDPTARCKITYGEFRKVSELHYNYVAIIEHRVEALLALRFTPRSKGGFDPPSGLPNTPFYPFSVSYCALFTSGASTDIL